MNENQHHEQLIVGVTEQYWDILNNSKQAVYIYFDDNHKVCNEKLSTLLGYSSPEQWAQASGPFPQVFVDKDSQERLASAYANAMENAVGSVINVVWRKKNNQIINSRVILVPISFQNHLFALHFVEQLGNRIET